MAPKQIRPPEQSESKQHPIPVPHPGQGPPQSTSVSPVSLPNRESSHHAPVGEALGLALGDKVGLGVGDADGLELGEDVGLLLGELLGLHVGEADGDIVGFSVVGDNEGEPEGETVGDSVGSLVGVAPVSVGDFVGENVGSYVGGAVGPQSPGFEQLSDNPGSVNTRFHVPFSPSHAALVAHASLPLSPQLETLHVVSDVSHGSNAE